MSQYPCDYPNLAPSGCTQYFFGTQSGTIRTYNYNSGNGYQALFYKTILHTTFKLQNYKSSAAGQPAAAAVRAAGEDLLQDLLLCSNDHRL